MKPVLDSKGRGIQIAALPWRRLEGVLEVLLVTSRDTGRFVLPKGWPMKALSDPEAAAREAWEEAGVEGRVDPAPLGAYSYDKRLRDGSILACVVSVYGLEVTREFPVWREHEQRTRHWHEPGVAGALVAEPELKRLIAGFSPPA